ncbi:MAG TPA: kelch repeat-containing protein [Gemmatimonadales bacterium]
MTRGTGVRIVGMRVLPVSLVLLTAVLAGCNESQEGPIAPSTELAQSASCSYSDDAAARVRTVTAACGNGRVVVPKGWSLKFERSAERFHSGSVSAALSSTVSAAGTIFPSPDASYLSATSKIDIESFPDASTHSSVSAGSQTISFSIPLEKRQVPDSWGSWSSPPDAESSTPPVLFSQYVNSLTLSLSRPTVILGFELEPNNFDLFTFTVDFFSGSQLVGSITRTVDGAAGAQLFAVRTSGLLIDRAVVATDGDAGGFAIAQLRYSDQMGWVSRTSLPSARRSLAAATASGLLYAIGGATAAGTALKTVQVYNPGTNTWTTKAPLPAARPFGNGATHISGTIYLPGGQDAGNVLTRTLYAYRISTNTWSAKANMPVFSGCGGSGVIGGKLYVYSGCTRTATGPQTAAALLHRYNPATNTWTTLRGAPSVHVQPAVTVVAGKLYVAGGNTGGSVVTNRVDVYNPATNSWSTAAALPTPRVAAAGGVIGGKLYVVGGRNGATYYGALEIYDPLTNAWTSAAALPMVRGGLAVGVISGSMYAIGGRNAATPALANNERLTP